MRELLIGEKTVRVRATPLALLFYRQEFGSDLIADMAKMQKMGADLENLDTIGFLQLGWAMAKADAPEGFPGFESWLASLEGLDFSDPAFLTAIVEEATAGFFRGAGTGAAK